ncbi:CU044_2847 family protein [Azospirillum sp.]|uniref:CU044_2847 family protein n=1 Tax=Azospirillum sp. TaxID=34012 RepID=UPI003D7525BA
MPTRHVRYDLAAGGSVVVEESVTDQGGLVGVGDVVENARQRFEALSGIRPATAAVLEQVASLVDGPDTIALKPGFSLKGEVGTVHRPATLGQFQG